MVSPLLGVCSESIGLRIPLGLARKDQAWCQAKWRSGLSWWSPLVQQPTGFAAGKVSPCLMAALLVAGMLESLALKMVLLVRLLLRDTAIYMFVVFCVLMMIVLSLLCYPSRQCLSAGWL